MKDEETLNRPSRRFPTQNSQPNNAPQKGILQEIFVGSWWLILLIVCCLFIDGRVSSKRDHEYQSLAEQHQALLKQKEEALAMQEEFQLHLYSSSHDPSWIELVLIRELGVIPDGQTKFFFKSAENKPGEK